LKEENFLSRQQEDSPGSPTTGEPDFLVVGKLRRPHGVRGEIAMEVMTDFPERLHPGVVVYVGEGHRAIHIRSTRWHTEALLVAFDEYADRESVGVLRNQLVYVPLQDRPALPEGEYYHHQLIGMQVVEDSGETLGTIAGILETGANDILVVESREHGEVLLPMIAEVVLDIDVEGRQMRVYLLPGLVE
jgi:16S rRNA processing protein RimM